LKKRVEKINILIVWQVVVVFAVAELDVVRRIGENAIRVRDMLKDVKAIAVVEIVHD